MARRGGSGPPGRLLGEVEQRAAAGWPAGLVVLSGDSAFHLDAAQRAILAATVPQEAGEYALTVYGEEKVAVGTVVAACRSVGMFSSRRVVLVRDVAALEGAPDALFEYADHPAPDSHLIVRAPQLDRRFKLHKALAACAGFLEFKKDPRTARAEIVALAAERGLKLDREAGELLGEICAGDLYRAAGELSKLAAWLGGERRTVGAGELREIASGGGVLSGWEVAEALLQRDRKRALSATRRLLEAGQEPLLIVGGIAFQVRRMWASSPARYRTEELLAFPAQLLAADRALKSRQIAPGAVLESLVDRMIGTG